MSTVSVDDKSMPSTFHHIPVLRKECIAALNVRPGGRYIDGTLGAGGHSEAILEASQVEMMF